LAHDRGMGRIYSGLARLEGVVPRIAVILGPTGASRSFPAALCDATVMLESAALCLGRPDAVKRMVGQPSTFAKLGGPLVQADVSGTVHTVVKSEHGALAWAREWLSHLPTLAGETPPAYPSRHPRGNIAAVGDIFERDLNAAVDMHDLIDALVDGGSWLEMGERHAAECLTGLARIDGCSAGIVANNAVVRGGILYPETCRKMTRFIRFCGRFSLPLIFLADTPGFMVGEDVERGGIVQAASDLYTAIALSPSARACIVVRKAYSAGLYAMAGPGFDSTFWVTPKASVSIFGPEALRRFRTGQMETGAYCGEDAMDEMLQAAMEPSILANKKMVDGILQWTELRERLAGFVRHATFAKH
ncbi:MAG: carboxyl transferase domain-containing protein, partial [Oceanidesulfovibrio sp.]